MRRPSGVVRGAIGTAVTLGLILAFYWGNFPTASARLVPLSNPNEYPPWGTSAALALTADGSCLLVTNPDSNSISIVDTGDLSLEVEIPVGLDPRAVTIAPDDSLAYVANQGSDGLVDSRGERWLFT